jgi:hypothetical protein
VACDIVWLNSSERRCKMVQAYRTRWCLQVNN